jgi:hypothetical protein
MNNQDNKFLNQLLILMIKIAFYLKMIKVFKNSINNTWLKKNLKKRKK